MKRPSRAVGGSVQVPLLRRLKSRKSNNLREIRLLDNDVFEIRLQKSSQLDAQIAISSGLDKALA